MIRLAIFDLDGTLAPVGKPINSKCVKFLKKIENKGIRIAISSGKTVFYQAGMFRQIGLKSPIFIGENGSLISFGVDLPPRTIYCITADDIYFQTKNKILREISEKFGDEIWLQPNEVMLTLFFKNEKTKERLRTYFSQNRFEGVTVYEHIDSFDVIPFGVNKKCALEALGKELNIASDEMIAVGDGINDIPMFEFCKYSIGLNPLEKKLTAFHCETPEEALNLILELYNNDK